jgi:molybdopterin/thiamine biosynthesis adenylyltransferase
MKLDLNFKHPKVLYPKKLEDDIYCGSLMGYKHFDTSVYNIVYTDEFMRSPLTSVEIIGEIINIDEDGKYFTNSYSLLEGTPSLKRFYVDRPQTKFGDLLSIRKNKQIEFYTDSGVRCNSESYTLIADVFSRNKGILESDVMLNKTAIITGCGSTGSIIALELARAGVGNFLLIDNDVLSYHNICRHQCGISDVGKFKVNAVAERILQINPEASVQKITLIIEDIPESTFNNICNNETIIIGCADNREGNLYANLISKIYKIPFVSMGLWERAFAGEIFYTLPNNNPCYKCFYDDIGAFISEPSEFRQFYFEGTEAEKLRFEPGISVDINYIALITVKLIIDVLNINTENYLPKVINYLSQFTVICNTNDQRIGGENANFFSHPLQISKQEVNYCSKCADLKRCILNS